MFIPLLGVSRTFSDSTVVNDTTLDGKSFYADLVYVESVDKYLFRTDKPGMDIIREIHAKNKRLFAENKTLKLDIIDCDKQVFTLNEELRVSSRKYDLKVNQHDNLLYAISTKNKLNNELQKKANAGKIMTVVGGIGIGVGIAGILYAVIITQTK